MLKNFNDDMSAIYESIDRLRYSDPHTPYWGIDVPEVKRLSPLAQRLYNNIRRAGEGEPYHLTRELYAEYCNIPPQDLHQVIDTALEFNFQITDEVWDMMKRLDVKLYSSLRHSVGLDCNSSRFPPDEELYRMLRRHPEFGSTRKVSYKPNAGGFKYRDIVKRIRSKYQDQEQDLKIAELDKYIADNRRFSN